MGAQWYDALVTVPGCDKNMPGSVIAMARLNRPSLMVYGGTIRAGLRAGQAARHHLGVPVLRRISRRHDHRRTAPRHRPPFVPGRGRVRRDVHRQHDGGRHRGARVCRCRTARRLPPKIRARPTSAGAPARRCARCSRRDLKPRDILTRKAFENALTMVMAVGGSTNAVLHLIAIARAAGVPLELADFQRASDRVPLLADLKPSGKYVQEDLHAVGGTPAMMQLPARARIPARRRA